MLYFNTKYPNGFLDVNFQFSIDEQDAKSILKQLKNHNVKYDKFLDCSLSQLITHIFHSEIDKLLQSMPSSMSKHFSTLEYALDFDYKEFEKIIYTFQVFAMLFKFDFGDSTIDKIGVCLNKITSFSAITKNNSSINLKISKIKEIANEPIKIDKINFFNEKTSTIYCEFLRLRMIIISYIDKFKNLNKEFLETKEISLRVGKSKIANDEVLKEKISSKTISTERKNTLLKELLEITTNNEKKLLLTNLLNSNNENRINLLNQHIYLNTQKFEQEKKILNQIDLVSKEISKFLVFNASEIDLVINNFHKGFILYNIKKIILTLGKNNVYRQKKFNVLIKECSQTERAYTEILKKFIDFSKFDKCDAYFQRCLDAVNNLSKDSALLQEFPEFSFLKADNNRKKSTTKKQKKEIDLCSNIEKIDPKDSAGLIEVKQEVKSTFKDISIDSVATSLTQVITIKKEEDASLSIIHEFDYLFRLKEDSIYAEEANTTGHFKACDLRLFIDALLKSDLGALGTIIPILFSNLAAQTEQKSKCSIVSVDKDIAHSHSLKRLLEASGNLDHHDEKFHSFINDFDYALIWMRYVKHSSDMYKNSTSKPQSLKWAEECIQLMQEISKKKVLLDKNLRKKLLQLVDFVFESNIQSYVLLSQNREELVPLIKLWREYLGVIKNQIVESLNARNNQYIENKPLEKNHPIMLLEKIIQEGKDNSLNLKEALHHLYRFEANKKLMSKYSDPILNPWFERNLISPWGIETLLKAMINIKGYTDLLSTHDFDTLIEYFEQLNTGDEPVIFKNRDKLSQLNIGIAHHYPLSHPNKIDEEQTLFKDYVDTLLSALQYITLTDKEKKRNRTNSERLIRALMLSQEVIKDIVNNYIQINKI